MAPILYIDNIPTGSHLGIDLHSWQTGPNFRGIRNIPHGLHCMHIAINGIGSTKFAVWLNIQGSDFPSYRWNTSTEVLELIGTGTDDDSVVDHMFLLDYPEAVDQGWYAIMSHMRPSVLAKLVPLGAVLTSTTSSNTDSMPDDIVPSVNNATVSDEAEFLFVPIDLKRSWRPGAIGRELTEMSLDKSWLFQQILQTVGGQDPLLAQFEFCFVNVLLFTSITSFDQWHTLLRLICSTKKEISGLPSFFSQFLVLLQAQMQQVTIELFSDIFSLTLPRNLLLLKESVHEIKDNGEDINIKGVEEELEILLDLLHREFGLEEEQLDQQVVYPLDIEADGLIRDDEDEDAPVVVDL